MFAVLPGGLVATSSVPVRERRPLPQVGEFFRFSDPATEAVVVRLTNPGTSSLLPAAANRFVSSKHRFLIFSSDRTGRPSPFQLDLRTGRLRQLAQTADLVPHSLCMDEKERSLYFIDQARAERSSRWQTSKLGRSRKKSVHSLAGRLQRSSS